MSDLVQNHNDDPREAAANQLRSAIEALDARLRAVEESVRELRTQFERTVSVVNQVQPSSADAAPPDSPAKQTAQNQEADLAPSPAVSAPSGATDGTNEEAQRYARLLVSEIELYNPAAVTEGIERKDLYARLKAHIDRSRRAYEQRFGGVGQPDYFDEAMVRLLAQGDAARLGPDYPFH